MSTLTRVYGFTYNALGGVVTSGTITLQLQQDIISVDGTKVIPFTISQDLSAVGGFFDKNVYATVGASPGGIAYLVEYDPDPTDTTKPKHQKDGYWRNYWAVPNVASVPIGVFVSAHRGEPFANYMPVGSVGTGSVGGAGSATFIPKWATTSTLADSVMSESSGIVTVLGQLRTSGAEAIYDFYENDQPLNGKFWRWNATGGQLLLQTVNDAYASAATIVTLTRTGGITALSLSLTGTPLAVPSGGTGHASWATGDLVYASGTSALSGLTAAATGRVLVSGTLPSWSATPSLTSLTLSTPLAATSGGTGFGSYAVGDLLFASTTTALSKLADVATGSVLISGGIGVAPAWSINVTLGGTLLVTGNATFGANAGTSTFVSQTTGWRVTSGGDADFRTMFIEELHAKSFMIDLEQASAGGRIETKSVAVLAAAFTVPAPGAPISTITRVTTTATVTTSSVHGFSTGDKVQIAGATQPEYNGTQTITVTDTTHYTYTVAGSPATPATGAPTGQGAATLVVEDLPNAADMQVFAVSDSVVMRSFSRSNNGLIIGDVVGTVISPDTSASGTQSWTFVRNQAAGTFGSLLRGTVIATKSLALDYGVSGSGYIESTTIDGTVTVTSITRVTTTATVTTSIPHGYITGDVVLVSGANETAYNGAQTITVTGTTTFTFTVAGSPTTPATGSILLDLTNGSNAPYTQIVTWATAPTAQNKTLRTRLGNLRGVTGTLEYGLLAGAYGASNGSYFRASNSNFDLHGVTAKWWDTTTNVIIISPNSGSPFISIGSPAPSTFGSNAGIFLGWSHASLKAQASFYTDANNFWQFDGTKIVWKGANTALDASGNLTASSATLSGSITSTSGTIGGWTLSSNALTSGTAGTTVGLDSGGTNPAIYAGSATPASAPFRVTHAGAVTATSGTIGGWTLGSTTFTGGNATLDSTGVLSLGTSNDIVKVSAVDATYRLWIGNATAGSAPFRVDKTGVATMTSVSISAGGVTLDTSGLFISPVSAGGGGAYANTNAVRWTTSTTDRTAIWRTDDTSTGVRTFTYDHITTSNSDVYRSTFTNKVNGVISGYGRSFMESSAVSTLNMWQVQSDSDVSSGGGTHRSAFMWLYSNGGLPGDRKAQFGVGTPSAMGTAGTGGTLVAGIDIFGDNVHVVSSLEQTAGAYLFPGTFSGLADFQTTFFLASHASYGLYTNGGMRIDGDEVLIGGLLMPSVNADIELGAVGSSNTPLIDFHSSAFSNDYDVRIQASGGSSTLGSGTLTVQAAQFNVTLPSGVNALQVDSSGTLNIGTAGATSISGAYVGILRNSSSSGFGLKVLAGSTSSHPAFNVLQYLGGQLFQILGDGSVIIGSASAMGAGTLNAQNDVYHNGTAYINPDYVFEKWATGSITKYIDNPGARDYKGMLALSQLEQYVRENWRFPAISDTPTGAFKRADTALLLIEELAIHLFDINKRLAALEKES